LDCLGGSITMTATPSVGSSLVWYANQTGGTPIVSGNSVTVTPASLPATYYIEPTTSLFANPFFNGGANVIANSLGSTAASTGITTRFNVTASLVIDSIKVVPTAAGTLTVALQANASATNILTYTQVITTENIGRFVNVPVNFTIPGSGSYQITTTGVTCT